MSEDSGVEDTPSDARSTAITQDSLEREEISGGSLEDEVEQVEHDPEQVEDLVEPESDRKPSVIVSINNPRANRKAGFPGNNISTTKYNIITFVPRNLFEQFRRFANFYFLINAILSIVPQVSPVNPFTAIAPLVFVLTVSAIKELIEDLGRYAADRRSNSKRYSILRDGVLLRIKSRNIVVGDIVRIEANEEIPADMIVLSSSGDESTCYVETSNLDGETNLKPKNAPTIFDEHLQKLEERDVSDDVAQDEDEILLYKKAQKSRKHKKKKTLKHRAQQLRPKHMQFPEIPLPKIPFNDRILPIFIKPIVFNVENKEEPTEILSRLRGEVKSSPPSANMHDYSGRIVVPSGDPELEDVISPVNINNFLLRGSYLRNTNWTYGLTIFTGRDTRLMNNMQDVPLKFSRVERILNKSIMGIFAFNFLLIFISASLSLIIRIFFSSSLPYIPDSTPYWWMFIQNVMSFFILYAFMVPISLYVSIEIVRFCQAKRMQWDKHLWRYPEKPGEGEILKLHVRNSNLNEELGQVTFIFSDKTGTLTENMMRFKNSAVAFRRFSELEELSHFISNPGNDIDDVKQAQNLLRLLSICHTVVPEKSENLSASSHSGHLGEGSNMHFSLADVVGTFLSKLLIRILRLFSFKSFRSPEGSLSDDKVDLLDNMDMEGYESTSRRSDSLIEVKSDVVYQGQSPDELALVIGAKQCGFSFLSRLSSRISISIAYGGNSEEMVENYTMLAVLEFSSARRRMSVLLHDEESDRCILYTKGADVSLKPIISKNKTSDDELQAMENALDEFSVKGLRTLVCGMRYVDKEEAASWMQKLRVAEAAIHERDKQLARVYSEMEQDLQLVGVTGIEDLLQPKVPETIDYLIMAGIKVWMLTGDKPETAINIAYSSHIIPQGSKILNLSAKTPEECRTKLLHLIRDCQDPVQEFSFYSERSVLLNFYSFFSSLSGSVAESLGVSKGSQFSPTNKIGLVIDGDTLDIALKNCQNELVSLSLLVTSVVCARITPIQKALVVRLMKKAVKCTSLAVGDGANDVSMIQEANVGVGIVGLEGTQAARASDFAISRFHHLRRLLAVHGRYNYVRLCGLAQYSLYKNMCFNLPQFFYGFFCCFSGQSIYDSFIMTFYNMLYTFIPPLIYAILEKDIPEKVILRYPFVFTRNQRGALFNVRTISIWMFMSLTQSMFIFIVVYLAFSLTNGSIFANSGKIAGIPVFGSIIFTAVIFVVSIRIAVMTTYLNIIGLGSIIICVCLYMFVFFGVSSFPPLWLDFLATSYYTLGSIHVWFLLLFIVVVVFLPEFVINFVITRFKPTDAQIAYQTYLKEEKIKSISEKRRKRWEKRKLGKFWFNRSISGIEAEKSVN